VHVAVDQLSHKSAIDVLHCIDEAVSVCRSGKFLWWDAARAVVDLPVEVNFVGGVLVGLVEFTVLRNPFRTIERREPHCRSLVNYGGQCDLEGGIAYREVGVYVDLLESLNTSHCCDVLGRSGIHFPIAIYERQGRTSWRVTRCS
jgi:hypothetical protein